MMPGNMQLQDLHARPLPSWLLSVCFHLGLLLLLALCVREEPSQGLAERQAEVGIALAQGSAADAEYFSPWGELSESARDQQPDWQQPDWQQLLAAAANDTCGRTAARPAAAATDRRDGTGRRPGARTGIHARATQWWPSLRV